MSHRKICRESLYVCVLDSMLTHTQFFERFIHKNLTMVTSGAENGGKQEERFLVLTLYITVLSECTTLMIKVFKNKIKIVTTGRKEKKTKEEGKERIMY